jgi:hypothetical protein
MNAETRGFLRRTCGGRTAWPGDADDALVLAKEIQSLDGFLGQMRSGGKSNASLRAKRSNTVFLLGPGLLRRYAPRNDS